MFDLIIFHPSNRLCQIYLKKIHCKFTYQQNYRKMLQIDEKEYRKKWQLILMQKIEIQYTQSVFQKQEKLFFMHSIISTCRLIKSFNTV